MTVSNESTSEDRPLVSILINNYNYAHFITEAIDSALNQTYPFKEVIVVDDGSIDNSQDIIFSYGERIISVLKKNGGQASTFNAGFAASRGDIICFLDSDDVFLAEKIAEVVEVFESHKDIGWCFHDQKWVDENTNPIPKSSTQRSSHECDLRGLIKAGKLPPPLPATSALCFKRSLLQQILPMFESEGTSADRYLKHVALALDKGFFLGKVLSLHRIHGSNANSLRNDKQWVAAKSFILTGYWLRIKFPILTKLANKMLGVGIGSYWAIGGVDPQYQHIVKNHLSAISLIERFEIYLRAYYHYLKKVNQVKP
ncbi:MAG: glycosyltransferase [Gloeocapsa sp. UFS-A4-WI-NPMV-4B04]|jgi:glycosyltransferase involved in cell wall biosynthesis|nr:glycosyltransferase [Gloeocapsa sp. UFS-A4-WI-NPMV-4B04]